LAGQIVQGCSYLRAIFDEANNAPKEIRLLTAQIAIIERMVAFTNLSQSSNFAQQDTEYQDALDFAMEVIRKLKKIVDKHAELDEAGKYRKWGRRLAWALSADSIGKHLRGLKDAQNHIQQYHDR
jgi:succinate dehydrogenase/fumarate reductase flavoprotein subunit